MWVVDFSRLESTIWRWWTRPESNPELRAREPRAREPRTGGLLPPLRQPPLRRPVVEVVFRIDLAHRGLPGALLLGVGGNAGGARDDEQRIGDARRNADIAAHGGNGP